MYDTIYKSFCTGRLAGYSGNDRVLERKPALPHSEEVLCSMHFVEGREATSYCGPVTFFTHRNTNGKGYQPE
jgi:hypothetical protein